MKIIKEGSIPKVLPKWWHNKEYECGNCNTVILIEETDHVKVSTERRPNGKQWIEFWCPFCNKIVSSDKTQS